MGTMPNSNADGEANDYLQLNQLSAIEWII